MNKLKKITSALLAVVCITSCLAGCSAKKAKKISSKDFKRYCLEKNYYIHSRDVGDDDEYNDSWGIDGCKEEEYISEDDLFSEHDNFSVHYICYQSEKSAQRAFDVVYDTISKRYSEDGKIKKDGNKILLDVTYEYDEDKKNEEVSKDGLVYEIKSQRIGVYAVYILAEDTIIYAHTAVSAPNETGDKDARETLKKEKALVDDTINVLCFDSDQVESSESERESRI